MLLNNYLGQFSGIVFIHKSFRLASICLLALILSMVAGCEEEDDGDAGSKASSGCWKAPYDPSCFEAMGKQPARIRLMAANITSGERESYDSKGGRHIFMAVKPDIVLLQEFKVFRESYDTFVSTVFGPDYQYFRGSIVADKVTYHDKSQTAKPNGIISRYPIIEHGEWQAKIEKVRQGESYLEDIYYDRQWTWAVIDIPGDRELLAVSVHLHTSDHAREFGPLAEHIEAKQQEGNYYVVIGGDFNTKENGNGRDGVLSSEAMMRLFYAKNGEWPVDQKGNGNTSAKRTFPLDWLMFSHDLEMYEIPTEIGMHTGEKAYAHGHVFDSRIYEEENELSSVPPVEPMDSSELNTQHMPVIRDVVIAY